MIPDACPVCGAPVAPGAQNCPYCGRPVPHTRPVSPPLPSSALPSATPAAAPPPVPAWANLRPRPRPRWLVVVAVFVSALLVFGVISYYLVDNSVANVQVTMMAVYAPDNVCGLNTSGPIAYHGFNETAGVTLLITLQVKNFNTTPCTIVGLSTNTSGFQVVGPSSDVVIDAGTTGTLNCTLDLPTGAYSGAIDLIFR